MLKSDSRREFLNKTMALSLSTSLGSIQRVVPASLLGLAVLPSTGRAQVAESFMVASAVAGLIGSRKKRDGGIGAMLTASLEYQRVIVQQLQDIQLGLAQALAKLNDFPEQFRMILHQERVQQLQSEIGSIVTQYNTEVSTAGSAYGSFQNWSKDGYAKSRMMLILDRLDVMRATLRNERWTDAVTSLYLPPAMFAHLGALSVIGQSELLQKSVAQDYLDLMERAMDPAERDSIGSNLASHKTSFEEVSRSLLQLGLVLPPAETIEPVPFTLGGVRIENYKAPKPEKIKCKYVGTEGEACITVAPAVPAVIGPDASFTFQIKLIPKTFPPGVQTEGDVRVRQFETTALITGAGTLPGVDTVRLWAPSSNDFLNAANASSAASEADRKATKIRALVSTLNQEMLQLALNMGAMTKLQVARRDTFAFFGMEI